MADPPQPPRFERHNPGLEFDRVAFFSDAVFAIAMTLLVVGIGIPEVAERGLDEALDSKRPEITSFFVSFVVIGNYWLAHHRFFAGLARVSHRLMLVNLVYLAAIAFTPFPTALAGRYTDRPISIVMYAITLGIASGLEAVMFVIADRDELLAHRPSRALMRYSVLAAAVPVVVFFGSIPLALWIDTQVALLSWISIFPLEFALAKWVKPPGSEDLLG
jgi:uncharacterized membrane protein